MSNNDSEPEPISALKKLPVGKFIDEYLTVLSQKYDVPKPKWSFGVLFTEATYAEFHPVGKFITFRVRFIDDWDFDEEATKGMLKYIIAHEFYHYLQYIKGLEFLEWKANRFASDHSKLSASDSEQIEAYLMAREIKWRDVIKKLLGIEK